MTAITDIAIWEAFSDPGKPVCIGSNGGRFTVNLFYTKKNRLKGVQVYEVSKDEHDIELVLDVGKTKDA